jgi:hypothetical protein
MAIESVGTPALWIGFTVFVLAMLAVRRKNSIRRPGKGCPSDARTHSADDDSLPTVVGAGRRKAGGRPASTGEQSLRLGDSGRQQARALRTG